jgi:hypothetical protein
MVSTAQAGFYSIPVTNFSFEQPNTGDCCGANATIPGWQFAAGGSATGTQNQSPNNPVGTKDRGLNNFPKGGVGLSLG